MKKVFKVPFLIRILALLIIFPASLACTQDDRYTGHYIPTENNPPELADLVVELNKGGQGVRRFKGEEVMFRWEAKGDQLRIHTDEGGVIVAMMKNDVLEVHLPGPVIRYLRKIDGIDNP